MWHLSGNSLDLDILLRLSTLVSYFSLQILAPIIVELFEEIIDGEQLLLLVGIFLLLLDCLVNIILILGFEVEIRIPEELIFIVAIVHVFELAVVLQDLVLVEFGRVVYLVGGRLNHSIWDYIRDVGVPRVISALLSP